MGSIPGLGKSLGGGNGNPLQDSCLENPKDKGAWQATVHGVTKQSDMTEQLTFIFTVSKFKGGIGHDSYFSSLYVKISKPTTLDMQAI